MSLVRLAEKNAKIYDKFLSAIGLKPTGLKELSVDRMGFSQEVAELYGKEYMKGHVAILTFDQKDASIAYRKYSRFLDDLLDMVFENEYVQVFEREYVIRSFEQKEALFGKLCITPGYASPFLNFEKGKDYKEFEEKTPIEKILDEDRYNITLSLDTPKKTMAQMQDIVKEIDKLDEEPSLLRDEEYLQNVTKTVNKIRSKGYSNLRSMQMDFSIEVDNFSIKTDDYEVYAIKNNSSCYLVYFGEDCPQHSNIICGNDLDGLLMRLLEENFLSINDELVKKKIEYLETELLKEKGFNIKEMNPWDIYNKLTKLKKEIPQEYINLWATVKDNKKFRNLSLKLKKEVVMPKNEEINELWERIR